LSSSSWSDKVGVGVVSAPPKSTTVAPRLVIEGAGFGGLVSAGDSVVNPDDGIVNPGVAVVDTGCRCVLVLAVAAEEVSI